VRNLSFSIKPKKVGDIEITDEFIQIYKKLILSAAKKVFGECVTFNNDERIVETIIMGELRNIAMFGHAYCPCRPQRIREHICPCEPAKRELDEKGICHCGLFIKPKKSI